MTQSGKQYTYFHCSSYKNGQGCTSHLISAEKLEELVLRTIKKQIELVCRAEEVLKSIDRIPEDQLYIRTINQQITEADKALERYRNLRTQAYTDMLDEVITKEEYKDISSKFTERAESLKKQKEELLQTKSRLMKNRIHLKPWLEDFKQYRNIRKLERSVAVMVINRITVIDKNEIEIRFNFQDEMNELIALSGIKSDEGEAQ